jgi:hypothetical protein
MEPLAPLVPACKAIEIVNDASYRRWEGRFLFLVESVVVCVVLQFSCARS